MKNFCGKTREKDKPYEIWRNNAGWEWLVLKKWQADDNKPFARWFCFVTSPYCPSGEYGDTYVNDIKNRASRTYADPLSLNGVVGSKPVATDNMYIKKTKDSVSIVRGGLAVLVGEPNPEAFLRGDTLDRFFTKKG